MNIAGNEERVLATTLWTDSLTAKAATVAADAIVLPKRGASIATNKKRITTRTTALDPNLMGVQPLPDLVEARYLFAWFQSFDLATITSGSTVPQLNKQDLAPLRIPLPPIDVQRAVHESGSTDRRPARGCPACPHFQRRALRLPPVPRLPRGAVTDAC